MTGRSLVLPMMMLTMGVIVEKYWGECKNCREKKRSLGCIARRLVHTNQTTAQPQIMPTATPKSNSW